MSDLKFSRLVYKLKGTSPAQTKYFRQLNTWLFLFLLSFSVDRNIRFKIRINDIIKFFSSNLYYFRFTFCYLIALDGKDIDGVVRSINFFSLVIIE